MSDNTSTTSQNSQGGELNISQEVLEQFPELIGLIKESQSMNLEERQYWVDVLPIMTDEQIQNLKSILENEKGQIEESEKEYEEGVQEEAEGMIAKFDEYKYKEKKQIRLQAEKLQEKEEVKEEAAILEEIANM